MFEGKTVQELDALMEDIKEARRVAVARERAENDAEVRASMEGLEKGTPVRILYKGEETEALLETLTDKRFTVSIDGVKRSIQMDKFLGVA